MTNSDTATSYCLFRTEGMWFAIGALQIREVIACPRWAEVPRSHSMLAGLYHEGSEFLPVLQLPSSVDTSTIRSEERHRQMLVIEGPNGPWGFLVNQVVGIESFEFSHEQDAFVDDWCTAVMGTATWQKDIVRVLNADGLYRHAEGALKRNWAAEPIAAPN